MSAIDQVSNSCKHYISSEIGSNFKVSTVMTDDKIKISYDLINECKKYNFFHLRIVKEMASNEVLRSYVPFTSMCMKFDSIEKHLNDMRPFILFTRFMMRAFDMTMNSRIINGDLHVNLSVRSHRTCIDDIIRSYNNLYDDHGPVCFNREIINGWIRD